MIAISIVAPNGSSIAEGVKTIEVRSWQPEQLPLLNLLVVENHRYLTLQDPVDEEGVAVAVVDVIEVHDWTQDEVTAACSGGWQPGYFAWTLSNVRSLTGKQRVPARRMLYEVADEIVVRP